MSKHLIDPRSHCQYIGWKFQGTLTPFRGHVKGALNIDVMSLDQQFLENQIVNCFRKQDSFDIYDSGNGQASILAHTLTKLGHKKKSIRLIKFKDLNFSDMQFEYCKNYQKLVPPEYLIGRECQEQFKEKPIQVIQFGYLKRDQFEKQNIPGSIYVDSTQLQIQPEWMLKPRDELMNILKKHNISQSCQTIVVNRGNLKGDKNQGWSIMPSTRLAIILNSLGFPDVKVLNGGFDGYQKLLKSPTNKKLIPNEITKQEKCQSQNSNQQFLIPIQSFKRLKDSSQVCIVDTRSQSQFKGLNSGYSYCDRKGKIQNSIFHGFSGSRCSQTMKDYQFFNRMKSFEHILPHYAKSKIDTSKKLIFYCGNGWRASQVAFYFLVHGYSQVSVYSNGWIQWSRQKSSQQMEKRQDTCGEFRV